MTRGGSGLLMRALHKSSVLIYSEHAESAQRDRKVNGVELASPENFIFSYRNSYGTRLPTAPLLPD